MIKISIITVCKNAEDTIRKTLESVDQQGYPAIEHIIVDGNSNDNTMEIVRSFEHISRIISEPDLGMYDALNKGISIATGDYIGTLNSDDNLHNSDVVQCLADEIMTDKLDIYFGDVRFVRKSNASKTQRYYSSAGFHPSKFAKGYMPAHPSVYIRSTLFDQFGKYKTDYSIAADYELMIRLIYSNKASYRYLNALMVDMQPGGRSNSNFKSRYILNKEIVKGCQQNGIKTNMFRLSLKYFNKIFEYFPGKR